MSAPFEQHGTVRLAKCTDRREAHRGRRLNGRNRGSGVIRAVGVIDAGNSGGVRGGRARTKAIGGGVDIDGYDASNAEAADCAGYRGRRVAAGSLTRENRNITHLRGKAVGDYNARGAGGGGGGHGR